MNSLTGSQFSLRLALTDRDKLAAQRLRYRVFVEELGGNGPLVDHEGRFERDRFDPFFDHLILIDNARDPDDLDDVVGVYRLLRDDQAQAAGGFYSAGEYDISVLKDGQRRLLELGRSCVDAQYRGGTAMFHLWNGLAAYTLEHDIDVLFGTASFHGTDVGSLAPSLALLYHKHLAPQDLRVRVLPEHYQSLNLTALDQIDQVAAMRQVPALIKGYLRLGGFVGDGAFVDRAFNTTDVCLVLDVARMNERQKQIYTRGLAS